MQSIYALPNGLCFHCVLGFTVDNMRSACHQTGNLEQLGVHWSVMVMTV